MDLPFLTHFIVEILKFYFLSEIIFVLLENTLGNFLKEKPSQVS